MAKILTAKELGAVKKSNEGITSKKVKKDTKIKETKNIKAVYELPYAPLGKSNLTLRYKIGKSNKEESLNITLQDRRYSIPDGMDEKLIRSVLLSNDFVDVTVFKGKRKINKKAGKYIYTAVHPEQTPENPINGNMSLVLKDDNGEIMYDKEGKQIIERIQILNGKVVTENKKVYQALVDVGFLECQKKEVKSD